jgi:hypothetical protein
MSLTRLAVGRAVTEDAIAAEAEAAAGGGSQPGEPAQPSPAPSEPSQPPAAPSVPTPAQAQAGLQSQLLGFVPTDAIAGFVALTAAFSFWDSVWIRVAVLVAVAVTAPFWIVLAYRASAKTAEALQKWPLFQMVVGTAAFIAWSTSVPESVWQKDVGLPGVAGFAIGVAFSFFTGLLVEYYAQQHRIPPRLSPATS